MRFGPINTLGLLFLTLFGVNAQTGLPFRVVDADYSVALDRMVLLSENPNQLHIYDPVTGLDTKVTLPKAPLSVSISPNGLFAAVGFDSLVGYVNLTTATISSSYTITGVVNDLVTAADYIHVDLGSNQLRSIPIAGGTVTGGNTYYSRRLINARLHPNGKAIYSSYDGGTSSYALGKYSVSTGPITTSTESSSSFSYPVCGGMWISADGKRLFNGCGTVSSLSETDSEMEMKYYTTLAGFTSVASVSEASASKRLAVLGGPYYNTYSTGEIFKDNDILLFETDFLEATGRLKLPDYVLGTKSFMAHGKWMYFSADGTQLHVVMQADSTSGLLNDFSILTYNLANPAPCVPVLGASTLTIPWNGTTGTILVTAPGSCIYSSTASAAWLQVLKNDTGAGNGTVRYHVRANLANTARSATITIGGQPIQVTQSAAPASLPDPVQLSFPVADGEYSAAIDRVVLAASGMNELHLYSPANGIDQVIPLGKAAVAVGIRPDGLAAAVAHDGFVSIVNLQSALVEKFIQFQTGATDVVMDSLGYVFVPTGSNRAISIEIATGRARSATDYSIGKNLRQHPAGQFIYGGDYSFSKFSNSAGLLLPVQVSNYVSNCENFWFSQDGGRIFTRCGTVLRSSSTVSQDLLANGSLTSGGYVDWADQSASRSTIAALSYISGSSSTIPALMLFGDEFLGFSSSRAFPKVRVGSTDHQSTGRFVFWSNGGSQLYVFSRLPSAAGILNDTFSWLVAPNIGNGTCTATLSSATATIGADSGSGSVTVTSGDACAWTSASSAEWLRISAGKFGVANGSVLFSADRNPYGLARSAVITAGGKTLTVTQAGGTPASAPALLSTTPTAATGATQTLTVSARDLDGTANISRIYFQIGASATVSPNGCHGFYDRASNSFFVYNDAVTAPLGPVTPGSAAFVQNGQCRLDGAGSSVTLIGGTDLQISMAVTLQGSYASGAQKMYYWVADNQSLGTGWVQSGTWSVAQINLTPIVVSGTPAVANGASQTFQFQLQDGNGAADLFRVYFLINGNPAVPQNGCHGYYERQSNAFFLYNDALTSASGPLTPGSGGTLQNSQCVLTGSTSGASVSGNNLQLTMTLRLQGSYATGLRNVYLWARDNQAADTGWIATGTWTAAAGNSAPVVVSGTPSAVTTATQTLNLLVRDTDGFANLSRIYFLINGDLNIPANTCHGFYDRPSNSFYLYSDGLTLLAGPQTAGTPGALQNSQCKLDGSQSTVTLASGTDLNFSLNLEMRGSFVGGARKIAVWATDLQGNGTGWVETGTWTVSGGSGPVAPTVVTVTPTTATNSQQSYSVTARDVNGYTNIARIYFLVAASSTVQVNSCHGYYDRGLNAIYLYNDALTQLTGPILPSNSGSISNSQCSVQGGWSVTGSGNDLNLNVSLTLNGTYLSGTRNLQFWVTDQEGLGTGWQQGATWTLSQNYTPGFYGSAPSQAAGNTQTFTVQVYDSNGVTDINRVYFVLNSTAAVPPNSCHGYYDRQAGMIYLYNDASTQLLPTGLQPGSTATIQNSQCSLSGAASSVTTSSGFTNLAIGFTKLGSFVGTSKTLYMWAVDSVGNGTGWIQLATWAP